MKTFLSLLILVVIFCGCASAPMTHGIPNFAIVDADKGIYRGGQPTKAGWDWLRLQGVQWDIKLNTWDECPESYVFTNAVPIWIDYIPITLNEQIFGLNEYNVDSAIQSLINRPYNTYIHCEHGQDRTGLIVAIYRVRVDGWTKQQAEQEMLAHGFHKSLFGLWRYWENFK